jgi:hypothetical protein
MAHSYPLMHQRDSDPLPAQWHLRSKNYASTNAITDGSDLKAVSPPSVLQPDSNAGGGQWVLAIARSVGGLRQQILKRCMNPGNVLRGGRPHHLNIHFIVPMNEYVAHALHDVPG